MFGASRLSRASRCLDATWHRASDGTEDCAARRNAQALRAAGHDGTGDDHPRAVRRASTPSRGGRASPSSTAAGDQPHRRQPSVKHAIRYPVLAKRQVSFCRGPPLEMASSRNCEFRTIRWRIAAAGFERIFPRIRQETGWLRRVCSNRVLRTTKRKLNVSGTLVSAVRVDNVEIR